MLTALFILTFLTGFFLGAIALVGTCTYLIRKDRKERINPYMEAINRGRSLAEEQNQRTGKNPFL